MEVQVAEVYKPIFTTKKTKIMLKSGRIAGKSYVTAQKIVQTFINKDGDIVVFRSSSSDNLQSIYNEIVNVAVEWEIFDVFETRTRPPKLINKENGNVMYFEGIGGADEHRTKGFKPNKKLSLIIGEELQQVPRQSNLDQAMATFIRHLQDDGQILFLFNPERRSSHWTNEYYRIRTHDKSWLTLHTSYKDIAHFLNKHTLSEIETERITNPSNYRYLYLGETDGLFGAVYASFDRHRHLVTEDIVKRMIKREGIYTILIGADPATTKDKTALIPILILNNGQAFAVNYFYHDPEKNGVVTNDRLIPYIERWIDEVYERWDINPAQRVDIIFDSSSPDLRLQAEYRLPSHMVTKSYTQKNVIQMAHVIQNAFSRNMLYVLDEGGIYNYMTDRFERGVHPLVTQLETVIWNDNGDGFEKKVDNDATDGLTYGIAYYFKNLDSLYYNAPNKSYYKPLLEQFEDKKKEVSKDE